ncbi:MAG: restriction endonuclease subunit S [Firmicutes bacterium]|nr:restriction endonuclease subunit S [Bacillota bacterium]
MTGKTKEDFKEGNAKYITYKQVYNNISSVDYERCEMVKVGIGERQNRVEYGDIIFTGSSETLEDSGMSSVVDKELDEDVYINSFCFGYRYTDKTKMMPDFGKYMFRTRHIRDMIIRTANGVTRYNISKEKMGKIRIAIPPLQIQRDIVSILDKFERMTNSLQEGLPAEIEARRKQYEYYRDKLLTFSEQGGGLRLEALEWILREIGIEEECEYRELNEICHIRGGYTPSKANKEYWEDGAIPWFRMEDIREKGRILRDSIQHVHERAIKGKGLFKAKSIIMSTTATIGEHAMPIVDYLSNQQFTNLEIRKSFEERIDSKYFYYWCYVLGEWCKSNTNVSGFACVDMSKLSKVKVPIPPLTKQQEIVGILDKFERMTNSLQDGLPAEIEARRKQYEYYRDKLLSFERVDSKIYEKID